MTIERPMFPPRAESVDSFFPKPAIGHPESQPLIRESRRPAEGLCRRNVLAGLAVLSASLPAAAAAIAEPDPIFAAIRKHTRAKVQSDARYAESSRWYREAERCGKSLKQRDAFVEAKLGCHPDVYTAETAAARWQAVDEALCTEPTTLAGVLALLRFAEDLIANNDRDLVEENSAALVATLAASIEALLHRGLA